MRVLVVGAMLLGGIAYCLLSLAGCTSAGWAKWNVCTLEADGRFSCEHVWAGPEVDGQEANGDE